MGWGVGGSGKNGGSWGMLEMGEHGTWELLQVQQRAHKWNRWTVRTCVCVRGKRPNETRNPTNHLFVWPGGLSSNVLA